MSLENWLQPVDIYDTPSEFPETGTEGTLYCALGAENAESTNTDPEAGIFKEWTGSGYETFVGHRPHRPPQQ